MATLTSITVSPVDPFKLINTTEQFTATAHYSDAPDADITSNSGTSWSSSDTTVATIDNSSNKGLATILSISGFTTIKAIYGGQTGTATLRVGLANYVRIVEQTVESVKTGETSADAVHAPISKYSIPNLSMFTGGITFINSVGSSDGYIGYTTVSGHAGDFTKLYVAKEEQYDGYWVQLDVSGFSTTSFSDTQRNLGIVSSISLDSSGNQLTSSGCPVMVQISGQGYVYATGPINAGDFLAPDSNGKVKMTTFDSANPTPILGFALENYEDTYPNMVLMRIQICGE